MDWQEMVKTFHLEEETRAFVTQRVKELVGEGRHDFRFSGARRRCGDNAPHPPHVFDRYPTVRWGILQQFCLGEEGETPAGELHIVVEHYELGDPAGPTRASGYWWVENKDTP